MPPIALSKTKLLSYLQCPRRLWLEQYSPELEDEAAFDRAAIATGRAVGAAARRVYGARGGHLIGHERGLRAAVAETAALLEAGGREPIFEATFDYDGLTVMIDILDRSQGVPRIVEVKSSTTIKDHHLGDCAIQAWTLRELGVGPASTYLALIDSEFVYGGEGDYTGLFREVHLSTELGDLLAAMPETVAGARAALEALDEPERAIGKHCREPFPCPFFAHCAPRQGEYPIPSLGGDKQALDALMREGYTDIRELGEERLNGPVQERIWRQTVAGKAYLSGELKPMIDALPYPRYFLDFETIGFAVPVWPGTRPYQALPFQWSCYIDDGGGGALRHEEFLDLSGEPPMRKAAERLIETLGAAGPIIVYTAYEKRVLAELADRFPDLAPALAGLTERIVDLHPIAKQHYYHPDMQGSWSIKALLPTIGAEVDYASLDDVQDGEAAQAAYLEAIHADTSAERREALREALLAYCRLDTWAMVKLVEFFGR